ncbi:hypothetical protein KKI24_14320 [bacterium]|nr:hypothetical protein [bacterium]
MEQEFTEAFESISKTADRVRYNISLGFFQKYASLEYDTSGKRFCDLKLHYKTQDGEDIAAINVPLLYPGSKLFVEDWKLTAGDELIVLFSDRSLEQWLSGATPQKLSNTVKDSINHAFAIPVVSHHYGNSIVTAKTDMLNLMDRFLGVFLGDKGSLDTPGTSSTGAISKPQPIAELQALRTAIQAAQN